VADLVRLNNISNPNLIRFRQVLRLLSPNVPNSNKQHVTRASPGFTTAADAASGRNPRTTVNPGMYYVFNHAHGMINVTNTHGVSGSWINPNR